MTRRESEIVKACLQYLRLRGVFAWRNNSGLHMAEYKGKARPIRFGAVGSPDIIGLIPGTGRFLGIECKRPLGPRGGKAGSELTPDQLAFGAAVKEAGGLYVVARDVSDVELAMNGATTRHEGE